MTDQTAQTDQDKERRMQEAARKLVSREVVYCISGLVSTLAEGYGNSEHGSGINELAEQAFELSSPIPDYEEPAREAGFIEQDDGTITTKEEAGDDQHVWDDWKEACDSEGIEPYDREVYEHWIVSRWLADKLEERGEKVDRDFAGMAVWARTTTGQAILLDGVICDIVRDLGWDKQEQP